MSNSDNLEVLAVFIIIGMPMLFAYFSTQSIRWMVDIGTFTCAWWAAWKFMLGDGGE